MTIFTPSPSLQSYDIFSGTDSDGLWIECVDGLAAATARMNTIAEEIPGLYFVYGSREHTIVARADTRRRKAIGA